MTFQPRKHQLEGVQTLVNYADGRFSVAPSLDRIDSGKPYTDDNVQVVAWFYNHMKHEHSEALLLDLCARILEHAR